MEGGRILIQMHLDIVASVQEREWTEGRLFQESEYVVLFRQVLPFVSIHSWQLI